MSSIRLAVVLVAAAPWPLAAAEHTTDSLEVVKRNIEDGKAVLVDVREKSEWDAGRLEVAVSLPLTELRRLSAEELAKRLPKDKIVYTHCAAGVRSVQAAPYLRRGGYEVRPLKPGYKELLAAGFKKAS